MPDAYGLGTDEEDEFQPGILPSQRKKRGLKTERSSIGLMDTGGSGATGQEAEFPEMSAEEKIGQSFSTNRPELSSERNRRLGLSEPEEPGKPRGSLRAQKMREQIRSMRFKNDVEEYGRDMMKAHADLAQAVALASEGNYSQAAKYITRVYDKIPDGGMTLSIGPPPKNSRAETIAHAGQAYEVITMKDPQGNIKYLPVNKAIVNGLIEQAKPIFIPQEYIATRTKMKAGIQARNADETEHPLIFEDGHVTIQQFDERTGVQRTEWFANEQDFIDKYDKPGQWKTPEYEKTEADLEAKKAQTLKAGIESIEGYGPEGRGLTRKQITELPEGEKVYGTALPRTTTGKPTIFDPKDMVSGRDEKGNEVNGWVVNGKFLPAPNTSKILSEKGKITEQSIAKMRHEFNKAYDLMFLDEDTGEYIDGKGIDDREKQLKHHIRQVKGLKEPRVDEAVRKGLIEVPPKSESKPEQPVMRGIGQPTQKKSKKTLVEVKKNKKTGEIHKIYSDGTREIITAPGAKATRRIKEPGVKVR